MRLLSIVLLTMILPNFGMSDEVDKPWTIHRKLGKKRPTESTPSKLEEKRPTESAPSQSRKCDSDWYDLFKLMPEDSRLRAVCLETDLSDSTKHPDEGHGYHCRKMAELLYCATPSREGESHGRKAFCGQGDRRSSLPADHWRARWHETYHVNELAKECHLTPQATAKEVDSFFATMDHLKDRK